MHVNNSLQISWAYDTDSRGYIHVCYALICWQCAESKHSTCITSLYLAAAERRHADVAAVVATNTRLVVAENSVVLAAADLACRARLSCASHILTASK